MPTITTTIVVKQILTPRIKFSTISTQSKQIIKKTEDLDLSTHPVRPVVKLGIPQRNVTLEQTTRTDRLPGIDDRKDNQIQQRNAQSNSDGNIQAAAQVLN